ncbi:zinc-dependent alcohol dehydrogenase [Ilumatobacter coccineus]|uniref:Putative zinc-containing alcohol dehydrogenase n=1 Tax=Ilumatobacter coccineus (strain NBRC 103263 / KCTC 29153 / YM16-304) TaxID=1313172 RepID=A0A6C7EAY2_ILUCY|nr:zinc-binding dehydrogenase [Ilumatobacter coccineus]BAN01176.1 putative zinc-containing alcohol dehydrogenase [Ilumatobacter coccineus YM16-304]
MYAALITGKETVELVEFPDPTPPDAGVVVDIAFCGICGTDIHAYQSGTPYRPSICGHEWSGTVSATGKAVRSLTEGDRVVVAASPACGRCSACEAGLADRCEAAFLSAIGSDPLAPPHGGFAPRIAVAESRVVKTDSGLTDEQAAQVEPATVAFHAVRQSYLRLGDTAVIQGAGPIGLGTMQWVRAAGAGRVIVIEPNAERRALALALGATDVVEPGDEASTLIKESTHGLGADIVYECVGRAWAIQTAVDLARRGGSICLIGVPDTDATISPAVWLVKEIRMTAALAYFHEEFDMAMRMMADGRVLVEPLHTSTASLAGLGDAIADLAGGATQQAKVLVNPNWA